MSDTTWANTPTATVTLDDVLAAWEELKKVCPDPLAQWMREQGFDPDKGAKLLWPAEIPQDWGPFGKPTYVLLSKLMKHPLLLQPYTLASLPKLKDPYAPL